MTDHYTDDLFQLDDESTLSVAFPLSRLVVDPERFENDEEDLYLGVGEDEPLITDEEKGFIFVLLKTVIDSYEGILPGPRKQHL